LDKNNASKSKFHPQSYHQRPFLTPRQKQDQHAQLDSEISQIQQQIQPKLVRKTRRVKRKKKKKKLLDSTASCVSFETTPSTGLSIVATEKERLQEEIRRMEAAIQGAQTKKGARNKFKNGKTEAPSTDTPSINPSNTHSSRQCSLLFLSWYFSFAPFPSNKQGADPKILS